MTDDSPLTGVSELMERAGSYRSDSDMPVLFAVGRLREALTPDGTVVRYVGQVSGTPTYMITPRIYKILPGGGLKLSDDHGDWFGAGNDELTQIDGELLDLVVIAEPMSDDLETPPDATNVVVYPQEKGR